MNQVIYGHGHHESVLRSHKARTVADSLQFVVPILKSDMTVLDIGCGPGSITNDLAQNYVKKGKIIGMDNVEDVLQGARDDAKAAGITNVEYTTGDIHNLEFPDNTFDLVYCNQVLQHIGDQPSALKEMKRVCKPGGIVAAREADYGGFVWYPISEGMSKWGRIYEANALKNGGQPNAGRRVHAWAQKAGFERECLQAGASTSCYSTPAQIKWWGELWADRTLQSVFKDTCLKNKVASLEELEEVSQAWRNWVKQEDAWFTLMQGEIIYRKP